MLSISSPTVRCLYDFINARYAIVEVHSLTFIQTEDDMLLSVQRETVLSATCAFVSTCCYFKFTALITTVLAMQLGHINCHATSTPVGDAIELSAVARLIATYGKRGGSAPIYVNSVKGHLGHCLGAAGAVEAVYSAMAAHHGVCVGNRNLERPISLAEIVEILERSSDKETARSVAQRLFENISFESDCDWAKRTENNGRRRMVLTNSFGFGGTNASLLLSNYVR